MDHWQIDVFRNIDCDQAVSFQTFPSHSFPNEAIHDIITSIVFEELKSESAVSRSRYEVFESQSSIFFNDGNNIT